MAGENLSQEDMEEAIAQLQYLQSVYSQRFDILNEQIGAYNLARDASLRGIEFLRRSKSLEGSGILVSTEGGTYVEASLGKIDRVMTYVGAGYLVEKSAEQAKEYLEKALKNSDVAISRLTGELQKVEKELFDISYKMTALRQQ
ncbi:MAG: prefoldin subunit alpha [Candidatus Micrarchaeaceae archaeon]